MTLEMGKNYLILRQFTCKLYFIITKTYYTVLEVDELAHGANTQNKYCSLKIIVSQLSAGSFYSSRLLTITR